VVDWIKCDNSGRGTIGKACRIGEIEPMFSTRGRLGLALAGLLVSLGWVLWQTDAAGQQRIIINDILDGAPIDGNAPDALTIPKDREATAIIAAVKDYVEKKDWDIVARSLQYLLEKPEDSFFEVARKDETGKEYTARISIRIEANRLIGNLPPDGLETYRQKYGQRALAMLQEGIDKNDPAILSQVALKYRHTEAGARAVRLLGNYFLDRGNYQLASGKFQELLELLEHEKTEVKQELLAPTLFKAALAHQRFGDVEMAEKYWRQLINLVGEKGVRLTSRGPSYSLAQLRAELDRNAAVGARALAGWPMVWGDASRTAVGIGGTPFFESNWRVSMFVPDPERVKDPENPLWLKTAEWVQDKVRNAVDLIERQSGAKKPILPGFFPIAGNNRVVFRTYDGVYAFALRDEPASGLKAGEIAWSQPLRGALHSMGLDSQGGSRGTVEGWWGQFYGVVNPGVMSMPGILFENQAVGTLSHDNKYVYYVDDLAVPPHPQMLMWAFQGGNMPQQFGPFTDQVMYNSLMAVEMETGLLKWEIGERKTGSSTPVINPPGTIRRIVNADGKVRLMQTQADGSEVELDPNTGKPLPKVEEPIQPFVPPKDVPDSRGFLNAADELMDAYFLGPPLPIGGKLYVLVEQNGEIQLCCIDPQRLGPCKVAKKQAFGPELVWRQPLGMANTRLMQDSLRRTQPCYLAYQDGILVCPTNAGAVIAVNLLNQSLSWAYTYRAARPEAPGNAGGALAPAVIRRGLRNVVPGSQQLSSERWYPTPPAIVNGKVIFAPTDGQSIVCLSLRDGNRLWSVNRQPGDLYLAGVYNQKVLVVGKDTVRALKVEDGTAAWDRPRPIGLPSGQGVASQGKYYLPCRHGVDSPEPAIVEIDIETGVAHATKSRRKEIPGNLIFVDGEVISQSIWEVAAYPQLHVKLAEMNARLAKNPNDPRGLTDRGELHLDKGEFVSAVMDLKRALEFHPDPDTRSKARTKLYEALTELFQRDFNQAEEHLALYRDVCLNEVVGDEKIKRHSAYLCILGKGRESQGRLMEAFDAYMEFAHINQGRELVPSIDEPGALARPDVWARGRIRAMIEKASPEARRPIEERVAGQWRDILARDKIDEMKEFVRFYGHFGTTGLLARLTVAERLLNLGSAEDRTQAELELHSLRQRKEHPELAAQATEILARLFVKKGLLRDAVEMYRLLGTDFKDVKLPDGRTGAEIFEELITDKRFLPYLEISAPIWGTERLRGQVIPGPTRSPISTFFTLDVEGDVLPFFRQHQFVMDTQNTTGMGQWRLRLVDRLSGTTKFTIPNLPPSSFLANQGVASFAMLGQAAGSRLAQVRGHLLMLTVQNMLYMWDFSDEKNPRKLWEFNVLGKSGVNNVVDQRQDADGTLWQTYADGTRLRVGQTGYFGTSFIGVPTRQGLVALEPTTGKVLWRRENLMGLRIFGDSEYLIVVESGADGKTTRTEVIRASDGVTVKVPDFAKLFQSSQRVAHLGRYLLLFEELANSKKRLRLYDVLTGKDGWTLDVPEGAKLVRSVDPDYVGIVNADGSLRIYHSFTGRVILQSTDPDARIQPEHLEKVQEIGLLKDRSYFYLILNRPTENGVYSYPMVGNGMKSLRVHGALYCYNQESGAFEWFREDISHQFLILEEFEDLPILLLGSMTHRANGSMQTTRTEAVEKRTGRLIFEKSMPVGGGQFYAMRTDPRAGKIELIRHDLVVRFQREGASSDNGSNAQGAPRDAAGEENSATVPVQPEQRFRIVPAAPIIRIAPPNVVPAIPDRPQKP
jgi:outer membrane protein assembly factor BamB